MSSTLSSFLCSLYFQPLRGDLFVLCLRPAWPPISWLPAVRASHLLTSSSSSGLLPVDKLMGWAHSSAA